MTGQPLPVRIYQTDDRVMLATPMPGLEAGDITVLIADDTITVEGRERGPHQHERDIVIAEWAIGPYSRTVSLPHPVDGPRANATYGNGVLVVSMPKMPEAAARNVPAEIRLEPMQGTRGEHVGHVGRAMQPTTTARHRQERHERSA